MTYDNILTSNNTQYDTIGGKWRISCSGVYWLLVGLAVPGSGRAQLVLQTNTKTLMTIDKTHKLYSDVDVVSLERPFQLYVNDEVVNLQVLLPGLYNY